MKIAFIAFRKMEDLIISKKLEPYCNFIQRLIGLDCFFLAKILAYTLYVILFVLIAIIALFIPRSPSNIIDLMYVIVLFSITIIYLLLFLNSKDRFWALYHVKKVAYESLASGCKNPHMENLNGIALYFATPAMVSVLGMIFHLRFFPSPYCIVFLWLWLINLLTGCTPLALRKSKLAQTLEKLKAKVDNTSTKDAVPQPA